MTIQKLLETLRGRLSITENAIELIISIESSGNNKNKAKKILRSLKGKKKRYKGKHWTQKPENKAKMMKNIKRAIKSKT